MVDVLVKRAFTDRFVAFSAVFPSLYDVYWYFSSASVDAGLLAQCVMQLRK